ncbi:MAG: DUF3656 domain-containing protein [Oscillospiraceae bacterium]|jgi:putative protease
MNKPEILAPAGSMESLVAAVRCGADAVYLGSKNFSARQNAANFDNDELLKACDYAHKCGVKIYQTVNTLVFDSQLSELEEALAYSAKIGIDGLIIQDLGAAYIAKRLIPDMPLHASTQMTIHTEKGAVMAKELGFSRVVLAREMSEKQIEKITAIGLETEAFVHGALCMSVSGQCYMSAMIGSRSANRGLCAQACRLPFSAISGEKRCDLSLKDMCHIPHIKTLSEIGVSSLKIEGRMKRPEYVAAAVTACRSALSGEKPDLEVLRAVFSRSGFTDGYFTGKTGAEMFGTRRREDVVSAAEVLPELALLYQKERKITGVSFQLKIINDMPSELAAADGDRNSVTVFGELPQKARNRPTDCEQAEKQLSKLGGTIYNFEKLDAEIDEGLMLSAAALNELRRTAIEGLDAVRIKKNTVTRTASGFSFRKQHAHGPSNPAFRIEAAFASQLESIDLSEAEAVIIPLKEAVKLADYTDKGSIIISLPRYINDEKAVFESLKAAKALGFDRIQCQNIAHIEAGRELNMKMSGGFGLNVTNSASVRQLSELGVSDCPLSFECTLEQLAVISPEIPVGIIVYGRLPLMLTVNCPIKQAVGCPECNHILTDRTVRSFPVICGESAVEILNSDTLFMADRLSEIKGMEFLTLKFYEETAEDINRIMDNYKNREKPRGEFTRGLYYRGIL